MLADPKHHTRTAQVDVVRTARSRPSYNENPGFSESFMCLPRKTEGSSTTTTITTARVPEPAVEVPGSLLVPY